MQGLCFNQYNLQKKKNHTDKNSPTIADILYILMAVTSRVLISATICIQATCLL